MQILFPEICLKYQSLFSGKNERKNISKYCLLKFLPSMLSGNKPSGTSLDYGDFYFIEFYLISKHIPLVLVVRGHLSFTCIELASFFCVAAIQNVCLELI